MVEQFINNDMIRATIAVSPADLPDYLIDSLAIEDEIEIYLDDWLDNWRTILSDPGSITPPAEDLDLYTKAQTRLKVWLKYYSAYVVAGGARTFVLKLLTDGNNRSDRFEFDPQVVESRMKAKADGLKDQLDNLLGKTVSTRTYSQFSTVVPTYDPVLGE